MTRCAHFTVSIASFSTLARRGHDIGCSVERTPRFPRNVRRPRSAEPCICAYVRPAYWYDAQMCESARERIAREPDAVRCRAEQRRRVNGKLVLVWCAAHERCIRNWREREDHAAMLAHAPERWLAMGRERCDACGGRGVPATFDPMTCDVLLIWDPPLCHACAGYGTTDGRARAADALLMQRMEAEDAARAASSAAE